MDIKAGSESLSTAKSGGLWNTGSGSLGGTKGSLSPTKSGSGSLFSAKSSGLSSAGSGSLSGGPSKIGSLGGASKSSKQPVFNLKAALGGAMQSVFSTVPSKR